MLCLQVVERSPAFGKIILTFQIPFNYLPFRRPFRDHRGRGGTMPITFHLPVIPVRITFASRTCPYDAYTASLHKR